MIALTRLMVDAEMPAALATIGSLLAATSDAWSGRGTKLGLVEEPIGGEGGFKAEDVSRRMSSKAAKDSVGMAASEIA